MSHMAFLALMQAFIRNHKIVTHQQLSNYHTCNFLPSHSTRFKILHLISTHLLIFSFITAHLPRSLSSEALDGVNILATHYLMTSLIHFLERTTLSSGRRRKGDQIIPPMPSPSWSLPGNVPLSSEPHYPPADAERAIKSSPQCPAHRGHCRAMSPWVLLCLPLRTTLRGCCRVQGEEGARGASSREQILAGFNKERLY